MFFAETRTQIEDWFPDLLSLKGPFCRGQVLCWTTSIPILQCMRPMNKKTLDGGNLWEKADSQLAGYAQKNGLSEGRQFSENADPNRLPFQRDRDRILHSTAFRRLAGKMQVVAPAHGDHFRTRLTHTLEVAQIARDLARWLRLNEDLAEAIALGHDLGHPPFGHAGEEALRAKMKDFDTTFEHNAQSLRIVEFFEQRYSDFAGINLTAEVREGLQKHTTFFDRPGSKIFSPHLEAQIVDISDEIAYLSADLEDGIRGKFFTIEDLCEIPMCKEVIDSLPEKEKTFRSAVMRGVIRRLLSEIVTATENNLKEYKIETLEDVQKSQKKIVKFSPEFFEQLKIVRQFLMERYYNSPVVKANTERGQKIVGEIFDYLTAHPEKLPDYLHSDDPLEVRICDYIAGMTDRFAENFST